MGKQLVSESSNPNMSLEINTSEKHKFFKFDKYKMVYN